jgi:uncharacterized protein YkwD
MGRAASTAVAALAVTVAVAVAGCGAPTAATELTLRPSAGGPAAIEATDGRLGGATALEPGGPLRELSPGGVPDLSRRDGAPRRDGVAAGAACAGADLAASPESLAGLTGATLCLLNGERADRGLAPLAANGRLAKAATAYAADLVAGSYFSHTGRDGSGLFDRVERTGYLPRDAGWVLGENLAWGTGGLATPGAIMQAWMNSPGHRENILNPDFREVGIGIVTGNPAAADGHGATYATEFGAIEGRPAQRVRKPRKRARRHAKARAARRVPQARRGGKGRGKPAGKHRSRIGHVKARIAM